MRLRAKFYVCGVTKRDDRRILNLTACTTAAGDNRDWSKYTPAGSLSLDVTNEAVFEQIDALKHGDVYYVDITPLVRAPDEPTA